MKANGKSMKATGKYFPNRQIERRIATRAYYVNIHFGICQNPHRGGVFGFNRIAYCTRTTRGQGAWFDGRLGVWSRHGCRIGSGGWVGSCRGQWRRRVCELGSIRWLRHRCGVWRGHRCRRRLRCRHRSARWVGRERRFGRISRIGRVCRLRRERRHRRVQLYGGRLIANYRRFSGTQGGKHAGRRCGGRPRLLRRVAAGHHNHHRQRAGCDS